jgi:hypothetical protein
MREFSVVAAALVLCACQATPEKKSEAPQPAAQSTGALASAVHTGDPKSAAQLAAGFYGIEDNAWRWTAKSFAVILHPPAGAAQRGATLQLRFSVPAAVTQQVGPITLAASIAGAALPPETYSQPGQYVYKRDVSAALLGADPVRVDFQLDKALKPSGQDLRELGVVAVSVGLEAK